MKTYTVEQFKKYLLSQDSMGDIMYNLSEANIDKANEPGIEVGGTYTADGDLDVKSVDGKIKQKIWVGSLDIEVLDIDEDDNVTIKVEDDEWICTMENLLEIIE